MTTEERPAAPTCEDNYKGWSRGKELWQPGPLLPALRGSFILCAVHKEAALPSDLYTQK